MHWLKRNCNFSDSMQKRLNVKHTPSVVQLGISDVNGCESSSFSVPSLSAIVNHQSYVHAPLDWVHSLGPILGNEAQDALEVAVELVDEEVVIWDDYDKCLHAMFLQYRKV
jgi:hypothetical protein